MNQFMLSSRLAVNVPHPNIYIPNQMFSSLASFESEWDGSKREIRIISINAKEKVTIMACDASFAMLGSQYDGFILQFVVV